MHSAFQSAVLRQFRQILVLGEWTGIVGALRENAVFAGDRRDLALDCKFVLQPEPLQHIQ